MKISRNVSLGKGWEYDTGVMDSAAFLREQKAEIYFWLQEKEWHWVDIILESEVLGEDDFQCALFEIRINGLLVNWSFSVWHEKYLCISFYLPYDLAAEKRNKFELINREISKENNWKLFSFFLEPLSAEKSQKITAVSSTFLSEERTAYFLSYDRKYSFRSILSPSQVLSFGYMFKSDLDFRDERLVLSLTSEEGQSVSIWSSNLHEYSRNKWHDFSITFSSLFLNSQELTLNFFLLGDQEKLKYFGLFLSQPICLSPFSSSTKVGRKELREKQNVIIISMDTVRADHVSCYGYKRRTTPCLDDISKQGTLFLNAYSPASWTLPAHLSLFSGMYSSRFLSRIKVRSQTVNFFYKNRFSQFDTLAKLYQKEGYITGAFTGDGAVDSALGFSNGFHFYVNCLDIEQRKDKSEKIFKKGINWIKENGGRINFFLFLHSYEAHQPHFHRYFARKPLNMGRLRGHKKIVQVPYEFVPTLEEKEFAVDLYDSSLLHLDRYLGLLIEKLEKLKLLSNTLIIILSDHGEDIWDHEWWGHGGMYDEVLHVPLIFYNFGGVKPGTRVQSFVSLLDIYPTLAAAHKLKPDLFFLSDGKDMFPLFQGKSLNRTKIFSECLISPESDDHPWYYLCLKDEHYKYLQRKSYDGLKIQEEEFYDLYKDPFERKNQAGQMPQKVEEFRNACEEQFHKIIDDAAFLSDQELEYSPVETLELVERLKALGYL